MIMMRNGVDFVLNAALMLTSHHVLFCLIQIACIISLQKKVLISQPGEGLDKRQCLLQIRFSPEGKQPQLGIVFCGAGKCISEDERSSWHKDVHMCFQENAWIDTKVAVDWVKKSLKPAKEHLKRFVLFAHNLTISKNV